LAHCKQNKAISALLISLLPVAGFIFNQIPKSLLLSNASLYFKTANAAPSE
jgi:hypothetical protein